MSQVGVWNKDIFQTCMITIKVPQIAPGRLFSKTGEWSMSWMQNTQDPGMHPQKQDLDHRNSQYDREEIRPF